MRGDCVDSSHTPMCSGGELKVEVVNEVVVTLVLECEWFHVDGDYGPDQLKLQIFAKFSRNFHLKQVTRL